jgi:hypothetical protein
VRMKESEAPASKKSNQFHKGTQVLPRGPRSRRTPPRHEPNAMFREIIRPSTWRADRGDVVTECAGAPHLRQ